MMRGPAPHHPKNAHLVEDFLARFKGGDRDTAGFWVEPGGSFTHIRYFAVRSDGKYWGTDAEWG